MTNKNNAAENTTTPNTTNESVVVDKNGNIVNNKTASKPGLKKWVKIALLVGAGLIVVGGIAYLVWKGKKVPVAAVEKVAETAVEVAGTVV